MQFLLAVVCLLATGFKGETASSVSSTKNSDRWKNRVFYQIDPGSFEDNNVDGEADIKVRNAVVPEIKQYTTGNIVAGVGYSGDSQQIAPQTCYNASVSSTSGQQAYIQLDTAMSFSELERKLGISVSIGGKFGMFSAEAKANYLRSIQDKDYSMSLNYYEYATNNVAVQLAGYGDEALNKFGKSCYNAGKNIHFGLVCGDNYITSYQQGALLIMGVNIKFSSSDAKKEFDKEAGASFGNIVNAAASIKNVVTKFKITGYVAVQAFQIGGAPSQLSKILNKDSTGQYYALTCSLTAIDHCVKAASGLLDYAKDDFSKQFSFENNTGLTPLGIAFSQYNPIDYIGLIPPASLVTQEVAQYRDELSNKLKENEYYQEKLYPFFNKGYPVELDAVFINSANSVLSKANSNVRILMQTHEGAADCFSFPDKCITNIRATINSQLQNITISDLKFLEDMKYIFTAWNGLLYNKGGESEKSWDIVTSLAIEVRSVSVIDKEFSYYILCYSYSSKFQIRFTGHSTDSSMAYSGTICSKIGDKKNWDLCKPRTETKRISPFFFEAYNIIDTDIVRLILLE